MTIIIIIIIIIIINHSKDPKAVLRTSVMQSPYTCCKDNITTVSKSFEIFLDHTWSQMNVECGYKTVLSMCCVYELLMLMLCYGLLCSRPP